MGEAKRNIERRIPRSVRITSGVPATVHVLMVGKRQQDTVRTLKTAKVNCLFFKSGRAKFKISSGWLDYGFVNISRQKYK